jgi:hypothetical protein
MAGTWKDAADYTTQPDRPFDRTPGAGRVPGRDRYRFDYVRFHGDIARAGVMKYCGNLPA